MLIGPAKCKWEHLIFNQVPSSQKFCANILHSLILVVLTLYPFPLIVWLFRHWSLWRKSAHWHSPRFLSSSCVSEQVGQACKPGASEGNACTRPPGFRKDFRPGSGRGRGVSAKGGVPPQPILVFEWMAAQVWTSMLLVKESVFDQSRWQTDQKHCLFTNNTTGSLSGSQMERYTSHSYEFRVLSGVSHGGKE